MKSKRKISFEEEVYRGRYIAAAVINNTEYWGILRENNHDLYIAYKKRRFEYTDIGNRNYAVIGYKNKERILAETKVKKRRLIDCTDRIQQLNNQQKDESEY